MENQLKFPSQQEASAQLKEKIDEVRAKREEQLKQYGKVMIETPQFDASGALQTPEDQKRELAYRQEHGGHSSNETATAH